MPSNQEVPNMPVAILIEIDPATLSKVNEFLGWLQRKAAADLGMTVHVLGKQWYNPDHGGVVIYQP